MISKMMAVVVSAATMMIAPAPVSAQTVCNVYEGHQMCATLGYGVDHITVEGPQYRESGTVKCVNYESIDWTSTGNMSQYEAEEFYDGYCEGRGTT